MPTVQLNTFSGINRRAATEVANPKSLYYGKNIDMTLGRSLRARGRVLKVADLHPQSVGLYVSGGALRAAIPGGHGFPLEVFGTERVKYDHIGGPYSPFSTGTVAIVKDSTLVTLTGGVWPIDIEGVAFYVPGSGATMTVAARLSDATLSLTSKWLSPSVTGAGFRLLYQATPFPLDTAIKVSAREQIGFSREIGGYPYIVIRRWVDANDHAKGVAHEHHWITHGFLNGSTPPATLVKLPFTPGPALTKLNGRLWATDDTGSEVRFCSVQFGPSDWTTPGDAGFLSVLDHALGDRSANGLGVYNSKLAVVFADAVQLWDTDEDPTKIAFSRAINGPGTDATDSMVNVLGDLIYFTRGGFRSLQTQTLTGQIDPRDDIGAAVDGLTTGLDPLQARAVWSQRRGAYLCSFGEQWFVYRNSPFSKVTEWTTWEFPGQPASDLVTFGGDVYFRSANAVYKVLEDADDTVEWEVQFQFAQGRERHARRQWQYLEVIQTGTSEVDFSTDPSDITKRFPASPKKPLRIVGSTTGMNRIYVGALCPLLATRFKGRGPWQLDSFSLSYTQLPW
jgi:hypothetical protein